MYIERACLNRCVKVMLYVLYGQYHCLLKLHLTRPESIMLIFCHFICFQNIKLIMLTIFANYGENYQ